MVEVYISLGSNINPEKNILEALRLLSDYIQILAVSTVYRTEPIGARLQPEFYNCVIKAETDMRPHALKSRVLRKIEERLGRKRESDKYAPRTIDLDILIYGRLCTSTPDLQIPDPDITTRPFLALALHELNPTLILPKSEIAIAEAVDRLKNQKMNPLTEYTNTVKEFISSMDSAKKIHRRDC